MKLVSAAVAAGLLAVLAPKFVGTPSMQILRSQQHGILTCGNTTSATECEKLDSMLAR
jgi:hypothetical protein